MFFDCDLEGGRSLRSIEPEQEVPSARAEHLRGERSEKRFRLFG